MNSSITNIVIVGRSNVGKSTLYNRLLEKRGNNWRGIWFNKRLSSSRCILNDIEFNLIDTAGYNVKKGELSKRINDTIKDQVIQADIIFVIDIRQT